MSLCASHRLPIGVRHLLERRAVAIALRHLQRLRARSGADFVEQLTDKTERVNEPFQSHEAADVTTRRREER
jgi:hypothetical protein